MRRGRMVLVGLAVSAAAACFAIVPLAMADNGSGVCSSTTQDPTAQGYCSPIPTCPSGTTATAGVNGTTMCVPPTTCAAGTTKTVSANGTVTCVAPTVTTTTGVAGATHTRSTPKPKPPTRTGVAGVRHTVTSPAPAAVAPAAVRHSGTLPFTGLQLSAFVLIALGLLAAGVVLRLTSRGAGRSD